jgi:hypothetical protein
VSRFRYTVHNLVGHPVSEILRLLGFRRASTWAHNITLPAHEPGTGRGQ